MKVSTDMSHMKLLVWQKKKWEGHTSAPNLAALLPTNKAFTENVKRADIQAILW